MSARVSARLRARAAARAEAESRAFEEIALGYREAAAEHSRSATRLRRRGEHAAADRQDGYARENIAVARSLESAR